MMEHPLNASLVTAGAVFAVGLIGSALAADAPPVTAPATTITLSDTDIADWAQMSTAVDACVAGLQLRNDATVCRGLAGYLQAFAGRVQIAKQQAAAPPAPPAPATPITPAPVTK